MPYAKPHVASSAWKENRERVLGEMRANGSTEAETRMVESFLVEKPQFKTKGDEAQQIVTWFANGTIPPDMSAKMFLQKYNQQYGKFNQTSVKNFFNKVKKGSVNREAVEGGKKKAAGK